MPEGILSHYNKQTNKHQHYYEHFQVNQNWTSWGTSALEGRARIKNTENMCFC